MRDKYKIILITSIVLLVILSIISIVVGNYEGINLSRLIEVIFNKEQKLTQIEKTIILNIRLPRTIVSILSGASLALAGALFQETFNNGLGSSDTLGVSSGASVGAAVGILLGFGSVFTQISALIFGLVSIVLTFVLSVLFKKNGKTSLILSGILVSGLFSSILSLLKYVADPNEDLPTIIYWLMGSVDNSNYDQILIGAIPMIVCIIIGLILSWRTGSLSLTDLEAKSRGFNIKALRTICIILATLLTSCSISMCGNICWIGLSVPHLSRLVCGTDNKQNFSISLILGGCFLILVDIINRLISTAEMPVSIFTGILGVFIFVFTKIVRRTKNEFAG